MRAALRTFTDRNIDFADALIGEVTGRAAVKQPQLSIIRLPSWTAPGIVAKARFCGTKAHEDQ